MEKRCSKCGEVKNVQDFRYIRKQKRYCADCRNCEILDTQEIKAKSHKQNLLKQIKKNWTELCEDMSQTELDQRLYEFSEIYKQVQQQEESQ